MILPTSCVGATSTSWRILSSSLPLLGADSNHPEMNMEKPYEPGTGSDGKPYVHGPGNGMDYDSGTLCPDMRLSSKQDAEAAARIANEAYRMGYIRAQADIRTALGIKG